MAGAKGRWESVSLRKKLVLVFLVVSLLPTLLMTIIGSLATYRRAYETTMILNTEGLNWARDQLHLYAGEMTSMFYALQLDRDFRNAVERWDYDSGTLQDFATLRDRLLTQLNRHSSISSITVMAPDSDTVVVAERAGVRLLRVGEEPEALLDLFHRSEEEQTNLFFKRAGQRVLAVHDVRSFEDRKLLGQIQAEIRLRPLELLMERLLVVQQEQIFLLNDEGEVVHAYPAEEVERLDESDSWVVFSSREARDKLGIMKRVPRREIVRSILPTVFSGLSVGLLSAIIAVIASILLSALISRPVTRLAERVKNIELQTLVLEEDQHGSDEVRVLEQRITLFVERIRELIRNEYDMKMQARLAQIDALQAQVNPHFLHNTLQLIGSISLAHDVPEVYRISSALSKLMRYSMAFEAHFVSLDEELQNLENYILIQKERFADRFSLDLSVDSQVRRCLVPRLLLQPLAENSFKHGFSGKSGSWVLTITAFLDESNKVHIIVRDNGKGIDPSTLDQLQSQLRARDSSTTLLNPLRLSEHIGLLNTHDRIRLSYADGDGLQIGCVQGEYTEVRLTLEGRT
ncbi:MAG: HAMP domain-containing protein [Spirochaetaceae bacterium]|nr:MAG: HAMP domain-containing protein [Spirochaetaceae bacterium]